MTDTFKYNIRHKAVTFIIHAFLVIVSLSCIFPLLWMLSSSLKTQSTVFSDMRLIPANPQWNNFYLAWTSGGFGKYFLNSFVYTVCVVFGLVIISSWAAYSFSRLKFPGKNIIFFIFLGAMMIPLPGAFVALYVLLVKLQIITKHNNIFDYILPRVGYIACMINVGLSLSIYLLKTFFDKTPKELEDAARIDGCSKMGIWWHVALPLAKPAIAVIVIFNALSVWNEYILATLIFSSKALMPLQRGLMVFQGEHLTQYPLLMAGLTITVIPILLLYLFMQKYIIKGITAGALVE